MGAWVSDTDLAQSGPVRLFCLPHAGSGSAGFHRWKRLLPESVAVCPVTLPGREARLREAPLQSAERLVQELHAELGPALAERPYAVFGHSMGALLAFRWVQAIEAAGGPEPLRLFVSGRGAPGHGGPALAEFGDEALLARLATRYGQEARALLDDPEMRDLFLPVLRADLRVVEGDRAEPGVRVRCGVSAVAGSEDESVSDGALQAWREASGTPFRTHRFPGGHFYHFGPAQPAMLAQIARELEASA